jgi:hypothetical protein
MLSKLLGFIFHILAKHSGFVNNSIKIILFPLADCAKIMDMGEKISRRHSKMGIGKICSPEVQRIGNCIFSVIKERTIKEISFFYSSFFNEDFLDTYNLTFVFSIMNYRFYHLIYL